MLMHAYSAGGAGGAMQVSGNGFTLGRISNSTFDANTAMLAPHDPLLAADADGGMCIAFAERSPARQATSQAVECIFVQS